MARKQQNGKRNGAPKRKQAARRRTNGKVASHLPISALGHLALGKPAGVRVAPSAKLWHPALSSRAWLPRSLKMTPTLRVRDIATVTLNATGANRVAMVVQPMRAPGTTELSLVAGAYGSTAVAVASWSLINPRNLANFSTAARVRMHRMALTITCLGPTGVGILVPSTYIRIGLIRAPINLDVLTATQIADYIEARAGLHLYSANNLMHEPVTYASCPIDWTEWAEFKDFNPSAAPPADALEPTGALAPIGIILSPSASLDAYAVNVHLEYDVLPCDTNGGSGFATSGAVHHPALSTEAAEAGASAILAAAGFVARGVVAAGGDVAAEVGPAVIAAAL